MLALLQLGPGPDFYYHNTCTQKIAKEFTIIYADAKIQAKKRALMHP